jgi:peptide/nickel transport system substrate-binding protein
MDDMDGEGIEGEPEAPETVGGFTRRGVLKTGAAGAAVMSSGSLLAACGGGGSKATTTEKPVRGGTLTVAMLGAGKAETMSVWQCLDLPGTARIFSLYDPLWEAGPDGVRPALVEHAEPNGDGTVWTITVRDGVTWHDGKPLTADDVVYTIQNWLNPLNYYAPALTPILDGKGVRKRDKLTVEVPLLKAVADFPSLTCYTQAPVIQAGTKQKDFDVRPVGTGAFEFVSFVPGQRSVFKANRNYWREGRPYLDKLIIDSSYQDDTARFNALQSGVADTSPFLPFGLARANQSSGTVRIASKVGASCYQFAMNVTKPPFTDVRVRQAMRLLADRQGIINSALGGYGSPGNDVPGHGLPYFASDFKRERDVEQARSLLKQAGQANLKITLDTGNVAPGATDAATVYARNAADAGVTVNVNRVDPAQYYTFPGGYTKRTFSFAYPGGGVNIPSLTEYYLFELWSHAGAPETHWGSKQDDALLFDAIGELDKAKATDKWHAVQQRQFDAGGYIIYADFAYVDGYRHNVGGLDASFGGWNSAWQFRNAFVKS